MFKLCLFAIVYFLPLAAHANVEFTLTSNSSLCGSSSCTFQSNVSSVSDATVTAYSTTGGSGSNTNTIFRNATTAYWNGSGLGVYSSKDSRSPAHSVDNNNGVDVALFSFTEQVMLNSITIGWKSNDADISVLAYTGSGAPAALTGATADSLLTAGWELIGHYADLAVDTAKAINTAKGVSSSYWLISAYNTAFGSATGNGSFGMGNDYFKIEALGGKQKTPNTPPSVPEPSILLLLMSVLGYRWLCEVKTKNNKAWFAV